MGHYAGSVGERRYTAMTPAVLAKLRDAVETIRLDVSACDLIALMVRVVTGAEPGPEAVGLTAAFTAALAAGPAPGRSSR